MRLGNLGTVADTTVLQPGSNLTFTVTASSACSGVDEQDVRDTLNNWASEMVRVNSVQGKLENLIPFYENQFDVSVTALKQMPAGVIRAQIQSALSALAESCLGTVSIHNEVISLAPGGTHELPPDVVSSGIPWSTAAVILAGAALAAVVLIKFK